MKERFEMNDDKKICPFCREEIHRDAVKCPMCRSRIRPRRAEGPWIRDYPERWLLGVASLLAHQTKLPVEIWRAGFVLGVFFYGIGPLLYLTIYILTPQRRDERAPLMVLLQRIGGQFSQFKAKKGCIL